MHRSRRILAGALASAVALAAAPALAQAPLLAPGTYAQISPMTKKPAKIGNVVVLVRGKSGKLAFSVNAIRALDLNQGFVAGTLPGGGHSVVWSQKSDGVDCRLTFTATTTGITVEQDVTFGDCGFGYGVVADGTYVRSAADGKLGSPPGP
jgi:hypothetical protein